MSNTPRWFLGTQFHLWRQRPRWVNHFRWAVALLVGLAGELVDMDVMIENVPKVYGHVTGGLLSKHLYHADVVIDEADAYTDRLIAEAIEDDLEARDVKRANVQDAATSTPPESTDANRHS